PCINLSAYFGNDEFIYLENVNTIHEGNLKKLFTLNLITVLETHGHDWSCLTYKTSNYLFPGESYIPNTITVTTFPNSNKIEAEISLKKIKGLIDKDTIICPGHGPMYKASELD
ncbi:MAG: MBL fold metallo-hydrolase, partial [Muribaculaceae bacterium]